MRNATQEEQATLATIYERIGSLYELYLEAMRNGKNLLLQAATVRMEHEKARDDFKDMKATARARAGESAHPTAGQANVDVRYGSMTEPRNALADNRWFIDQHPGYASEAAAYFAQATAFMSAIQYQTTKIQLIQDALLAG